MRNRIRADPQPYQRLARTLLYTKELESLIEMAEGEYLELRNANNRIKRALLERMTHAESVELYRALEGARNAVSVLPLDEPSSSNEDSSLEETYPDVNDLAASLAKMDDVSRRQLESGVAGNLQTLKTTYAHTKRGYAILQAQHDVLMNEVRRLGRR